MAVLRRRHFFAQKKAGNRTLVPTASIYSYPALSRKTAPVRAPLQGFPLTPLSTPLTMADLSRQGRYRHWLSGLAVAVLGLGLSLFLGWKQADSIAQLEAARAQLAQTNWRVEQKSQDAPQAGLVYDTFFVQGEWVPAGRPVVSLLPPGNIKLRFFVPETAVGAIKVGQHVTVSCDGCGTPIPATVSYVSPQPEYTPPVIYSREERAKLVFLIEARPDATQATRLKPGQPVDVKLGQ